MRRFPGMGATICGLLALAACSARHDDPAGNNAAASNAMNALAAMGAKMRTLASPYEGHWVVDPNPGFKLAKPATDLLAAHSYFDIKSAGICQGPPAMLVTSCRYLIVGGGDGGKALLNGRPDGADGLKIIDPMSAKDQPATMHIDRRTGDVVFGDGGSQAVFLKRGPDQSSQTE